MTVTVTNSITPKWKTWQYWLRLFIFSLFVIFLTIVIGQIVFMYFETKAIVQPAPSRVTQPDDFNAEAVSFTGGDDLELSGWYAKPENGAVIILLHGYGGNRTQLLWHARQLVEAGFGVLLYDLRGHGESQGEQRSNGWRDVDDVAGAVDFLSGRTDHIGIYGFSVGGQIALRSAARMPAIEAIFVDGPGGATAKDMPPPINIQEQFIFRLAPIGDWMLSQRSDTPIPTALVDILPQIAPRPIYYVAGGRHPNIPGGEVRLVRPYYELTADHAQIWEIPDVGHGGGWRIYPDEYAENMIAFFTGSLLIDD